MSSERKGDGEGMGEGSRGDIPDRGASERRESPASFRGIGVYDRLGLVVSRANSSCACDSARFASCDVEQRKERKKQPASRR